MLIKNLEDGSRFRKDPLEGIKLESGPMGTRVYIYKQTKRMDGVDDDPYYKNLQIWSNRTIVKKIKEK